MNAPALTAPGLPETPGNAAAICAHTLAQHSKSFALAGKLLADQPRRDAAVLYTYCRVVDDSIDLVEADAQPAALAELHRALDSIYRGEAQPDIRLHAFQELVQRRRLPRDTRSSSFWACAWTAMAHAIKASNDLLLYCHRVAGVVGLMMCHVLGLPRHPRAEERGTSGHCHATDQHLPRRGRGLAAWAFVPAAEHAA